MNKFSAMIVDDSDTDRYLLKRFLGKTDLVENIFEANDGKSALDLLRNFAENKKKFPNGFPPTFLFLDVNMPNIGGLKFLEEYQALAEECNELSMIIMMFSSSSIEEDKNKAFSYPFVKDYLVKGTFKVNDLKEKMLSYYGK
jgi:CheY-like chemotaxis protein